MNKKRAICGFMAAVMLLPAYSASAAVKSNVSIYSKNEKVVLGTNRAGDSYASQGEVNDLTVDDAVEKAINYSRTLKNIDENIEIVEIDEKATRFAWESTGDATASISYGVSLRNIKNSLDNYDKNKEVEKTKIDYNVRQLFYGLKDGETSLELYDKNIELSERQLEIYKVMLKVGKMSQVEYDAKVTEHQSLVDSRLAVQNSIDAAYRTLNQLMGTNVNTKYNIIVDDLAFNPMSDTLNLNSAISIGLASNQSLKELSDTLSVAKYTKDTYFYRAVTGETNSDYETIASQYAQASRGYEDSKTALVTKISGIYDDIKNAESEQKQNEATLKDMQSQLEVMKTQLALGKTTQIEVDAYELSIEKLQDEMKSAARSYDLLLRQFDNSDLISIS